MKLCEELNTTRQELDRMRAQCEDVDHFKMTMITTVLPTLKYASTAIQDQVDSISQYFGGVASRPTGRPGH